MSERLEVPLDLDRLTATDARFIDTEVILTITKEAWEKLGRPVHVVVKVEAIP